MNTYEGIGLGILQGVTEFLPISSSGHLVIMQALLKVKRPESVIFEVALHLASLLAVLIYYRKILVELFSHLIALPWLGKSSRVKNALWIYPTGRLFSMIIIASIPTALIGLVFKVKIEALFNQPQIVGFALLITSFLLFSTFFRRKNEASILGMTPLIALIIGTAQGIALLPGISRSGITISVALLLGLERKLSADFSFLLFIPAVFGAVLLGLKEIGEIHPLGIIPIISGFLAATFTSYLTLSFLIRIVRKGKFFLFAPYCLLLGLFAIFYF